MGDILVRHAGPWPLTLPLQHSKRVPLEGAELVEWERARAMEAEAEEKDGASGMACTHVRAHVRICVHGWVFAGAQGKGGGYKYACWVEAGGKALCQVPCVCVHACPVSGAAVSDALCMCVKASLCTPVSVSVCAHIRQTESCTGITNTPVNYASTKACPDGVPPNRPGASKATPWRPCPLLVPVPFAVSTRNLTFT